MNTLVYYQFLERLMITVITWVSQLRCEPYYNALQLPLCDGSVNSGTVTHQE